MIPGSLPTGLKSDSSQVRCDLNGTLSHRCRMQFHSELHINERFSNMEPIAEAVMVSRMLLVTASFKAAASR